MWWPEGSIPMYQRIVDFITFTSLNNLYSHTKLKVNSIETLTSDVNPILPPNFTLAGDRVECTLAYCNNGLSTRLVSP